MIANLEWRPHTEVHEDGMPYLMWDLDYPADVEVVTSIDDYNEGAYEEWGNWHCMSIKELFKVGYQPEIDEVLNG